MFLATTLAKTEEPHSIANGAARRVATGIVHWVAVLEDMSQFVVSWLNVKSDCLIRTV